MFRPVPAALALVLMTVSMSAHAQTVEQDNLDISVQRLNECNLSVSSAWSGHHVLALGDVAFVDGMGIRGGNVFVASFGWIIVECNKDVAYTVDIDQGMHYGMGPQSTKRALSDGQGHFISYDIWTDYDTGVEWMVGRGSKSGVANEFIQSYLDTGDRQAYGSEWNTPGDFWQVNMAPGGIYWDRNVVTLTYN